MKLTIFNGSPKALKSNTKIILDWFLKGYNEVSKDKPEIYYLAKSNQMKFLVEKFADSEIVILAFPLYHDSMPAVVKTFIEFLQPYKNKTTNPKLGFIVQSGFPEANHSRYVEKYLEKLCKRLHTEYLGTIIKGGVEGVQVRPDWINKSTYNLFYKLGLHFGLNNEFDIHLVSKLAKPEFLTKTRLILYRLLSRLGIANLYWDKQLKDNNAYEERFDKPYISS